jgi:hypothetical protein
MQETPIERQPITHAGVSPGALDQQARYAEMLRRIELLEDALAKVQPVHGGIGHNNPPEPIGAAFDDEDRRAVETAIGRLKALPPESEAAPVTAQDAALTFRTIAEKIWREAARASGYVGVQIDTFVSEAVKSAGTEFGNARCNYRFGWRWPPISTASPRPSSSGWRRTHTKSHGDRGILRVVQSLEQTKAEVRFKDTKTSRNRAITLPAFAVEDLRRVKRSQAEELFKLGVRQTGETFACCRAVLSSRWRTVAASKPDGPIQQADEPAQGYPTGALP